jgi:adenosine deaminase
MSPSHPEAPAPLSCADIAALPKVSLHDHLEGGLRAGTVLELADAAGVNPPAHTVEGLQRWFAEGAEGSSLERYLEPFWLTDAVMHRADHLQRLAREFAEDLAADGVVYGEVRWAPETKCSDRMSLEEAVEAVQSGLDSAAAGLAAAGRHIRVTQILCAMRDGTSAGRIAQLCLDYRDRGVVGFDIAGPEAGYPASRHREAFDLLARQLMPVTVHAGEAAGLDSIESALTHGRAVRLGHGVRIVEDITPGAEPVLGRTARWVMDRRVVLETSPTSNLQTGAVPGRAIAQHPFDRLYRLGFAVTVNTDNRLMSQTTLTRELALLAETFGYKLGDLLRWQLTAADGAFLPHNERKALKRRLETGYARVEATLGNAGQVNSVAPAGGAP